VAPLPFLAHAGSRLGGYNLVVMRGEPGSIAAGAGPYVQRDQIATAWYEIRERSVQDVRGHSLVPFGQAVGLGVVCADRVNQLPLCKIVFVPKLMNII